MTLARTWLPVLITCAMTTLAGAADNFVLELPIQCSLGRDCFIQNYMDDDASDQAHDYRCGGRTYNRHNGTDFRIPSMAAQARGVSVLSAADGVILRMRDGVDDVSARVTGREAVKGKECGNGIVITHADGWSTQYCHLAKGSVSVRPGQQVRSGQNIGFVGLSGDTEFPHVHLTVRKDGAVVDPFAFQANAKCGGGQSLWAPALSQTAMYREGEVTNAGFTSIKPSMDAIESGEVDLHSIADDAPLIAYVRAIGLEKGDEQSLRVYFPDGKLLAEGSIGPLDNNKAQFFISAGRRGSKWPVGVYRATYSVKRSGNEVLSKAFEARKDQ